MVKAAFVVGAKRGDGLVTCRNEDTGGWGAPAFFRIKGVSWGLQIGAQSADVILMIMNEEGVDGLLKAKVSLGGDMGVTAGPVGRNASVNIDLLLKSPMISYARSKGVFAGLNLEGSTIIFNKEATEKRLVPNWMPRLFFLKPRPCPKICTLSKQRGPSGHRH